LYNILILGTDKTHEYEELIKTFLRTDSFRLLSEMETAAPDAVFTFTGDKNRLKYQLYQYLNLETGIRPPWGIVTGIRPVKLTGDLLQECKDPEIAKEILIKEYLVTKTKAAQAVDMVLHQHNTVGFPSNKSVGIYVGIPFCPSRCAYCSFTSNQATEAEMERYLIALLKEIRFVQEQMHKYDWFAETIYIGGGTPTSLNLNQLDRLYSALNEAFHSQKLKEFTLEAGRPDTITQDNMSQAVEAGITRISINPQSMHDKTLRLIGRNHNRKQVQEAFEIAENAGVDIINTDIIAGLPGETLKEFAATLDEILTFYPKNITVHSLAMKRTSRLTEENKNFHFEQAEVVAKMLEYSEKLLLAYHYTPYYMYRQKQMAGSLENIGYCTIGTESIYNIRIMEENQTIIALGAGGISKAYDPIENRLDRIANVSNYEIYIERLDDMILRKENDLFRRFELC
jgi:oxygen-independent coproporphyrinogen-3 oxidase